MMDLTSVPLDALLAEIRRRRFAIDAVLADCNKQPWQEVVNAVSTAFSVKASTLWLPGKQRRIVQPRQACMVLMRQRLGMIFEDIGNVFRKDHGTAIHAMATQSSRMTEGDYARCYNAAVATLDASSSMNAHVEQPGPANNH